MKTQISILSQLAELRSTQVRGMLGRVTYQQGLCQRYRNNIAGLNRLCGFTSATTTPLQRHNQQQYKATLHNMINLQSRELLFAEENLRRLQSELMQVMRQEKVLTHVIDGKIAEWQQALAHQEQKIQDGLAVQSWWRNKPLLVR